MDTFIPNPSDEECLRLFACLQAYLPAVRLMLRRLGYPAWVANDAVEFAESVAGEAIASGLASSMTRAARRRWLCVVAIRAAAAILRRPRPSPLPPDPPIPCRSGLDDALRAAVLAAVARLPTDLRTVVEAVYFGQVSLRSAADRLGIPESTCRRRHEKAKQALRKMLG